MIANGRTGIETTGALPIEIVNLARNYAPRAIAKLFAVMQEEGTPPAVVVKCAEVILDRAYGKAPQAVLVGDATASQQAGMTSIPILDRVAAILEARNITNSTRDLEASEITVEGEMMEPFSSPTQPINVTPAPALTPADNGDDLI